LLAKAVAKESGSRMIEIQASDMYESWSTWVLIFISVTNAQIDPFSRYEMYVGEGEKNVKV
jgi:SpoVK/Ycf46/Vps4 family AAA+-type ATPase